MQNQPPQIGNSELISTVNSKLVLQAIRAMQPTYRAAVSRTTRLKPATVTGIINDLLRQRLVRETRVSGDVGPRGGRPPKMLELNADAKRVLAIDLEPDIIRVAMTDLLVNVLDYEEQIIDRFSDPETVLEAMLRIGRKMLGKTPRSKVLGIGVSLPGLIGRDRGMLISSTNMPRWHNVPIAALLAGELELPVKVESSVHLAACHENWSSPREPGRSSVFLLLRTGIGMSLIHRGEIYSGPLGFDGEIGHTVVDVNGRTCECGGRGCLETFVSASAICERGRALLDTAEGAALRRRLDAGDLFRPELIYRLAKEGDPGCTDVVMDVGRYLGIAASNMINLFAPHEVVIGGSIDFADDLIVEALEREIRRSALPLARDRVKVRLARAQERASLLGAAVLMIQQLFELPRLNHSIIQEPGLMNTSQGLTGTL